jgi:hypothetical protein
MSERWYPVSKNMVRWEVLIGTQVVAKGLTPADKARQAIDAAKRKAWRLACGVR